jgi:hypothetical protein
MRKFLLATLALTLLASPAAASAGGLHLELSLGSGVTAGVGTTERVPTTVGAAVGYGFTDMLKLQVGAFVGLGDVQDSTVSSTADDQNLDLRAMVKIEPPVFPLYFRGIMGITDLVKGEQNFTWGGAVGMGFGLFGIGGFVEAGAMQKTFNYTVPGAPAGTPEVSQKGWQVEGRIGVSIG